MIDKIIKWFKDRKKKKLNKSIKIVYEGVDKFLMYGDAVPEIVSMEELNRFALARLNRESMPISIGFTDPPEVRIRKALEQHGFIQKQTTFDPETIKRAYEGWFAEFAQSPVIMGSPRDSIEFVDAPREAFPFPSRATIIERQRQANVIMVREAQQSIEPIIMDLVRPFLEVVAVPLQHYQDLQRALETQPGLGIDPEGLKEYTDFLKNDIAAGCGIPVEELFKAPEEPMILYPRSHGRTAMTRIMQQILQNTEQWDINEMMQNPHPEPSPAPPGQARQDYLDALTSSIRAFESTVYPLTRNVRVENPEDLRIGGEVVWSGKIIKENREHLRKKAMKRAFDDYIKGKAGKQKKHRMCYEPDCKQVLDFYGFIATQRPKTFIEYYQLKRMWHSKYVELYCCNCYDEKERFEKLRTKYKRVNI